MKRHFLINILVAGLLVTVINTVRASLPAGEVLQGWVQEMKTSSRGPFKRIRWFCNDGTIQPPKEYACKEHGGGVQHGEWTERVKLLRDNGYYIANVFADVKPEDLLTQPESADILKQMILEQFLIRADDGWIFRKARYYRGALQVEDETRGGRNLLLALAAEPGWRRQYFLSLREAVRFFPHGRQGAPTTEMRQLSLAIAESDKNFEKLRIKIHVKPELGDAAQVRAYAAQRGATDLAEDYERLAVTIEEIYRPQDIQKEIRSLAKQVRNKRLARLLVESAAKFDDARDSAVRFSEAGRLLAALRDGMPEAGRPEQMLAVLDTSLSIEGDMFRSSTALLEGIARANRRQRLSWLQDSVEGLYGIGLISMRQREAVQESLAEISEGRPSLNEYKDELVYAARVPEWADRTLRFQFDEAISVLEILEPLTRRYVHDRLRGSLLLFYAEVLDGLMADANRQLGIRNTLFNQTVDAGLNGLNPGLARGVLRVFRPGDSIANLDRSGIYVLSATTENLPPVAGIITAGKGNMLSHVQLLARNLGIPNVAVSKRLLSQITAKEGRRVVLAVSPRGVVQLQEDNPGWDTVFAEESKTKLTLIRPDLEKLDLTNHRFMPLQNIRATDSGRISGPKAANLGELKYHFPEAVTGGLVIPFGQFRALLDRPIEPGGPSVFTWMQDQYALIDRLKNSPARQEQATRGFLKKMRDWIVQAEPGQDFRNRLYAAMNKTFGPDGTYGVFVRSDTNVEDLPGFTGAGLNLTEANVVGFENVLAAIRRVWASPFSERAYRWRQAYMDHPEHVYVSVLLMQSVPAEKSGVMVTADVDTGQRDWLTIAVNEGVGGAVSGQTAEELRIHTPTGYVRLMYHASEPYKRVLLGDGGMSKISASGAENVLTPKEIDILVDFAAAVPQRFPRLLDAAGQPVPADIEFGFYREKLVLFQIRPFLESAWARQNLFLNSLDQGLQQAYPAGVDLDAIPTGGNQ